MTYTQNPLDAFEQTIQASRALSWMIYCTHMQGDSLNLVQDGIHSLLETQNDLLESIAEKLRAGEAARTQQLHAEPVRKAAVKFAANVDPELAAKIQREDHELEALHRQSERMQAPLAGFEEPPTATDLRNQFIADKMREGIEIEDIAEAVNMKRAAVEKIVAQMLGTAKRQTPPSGKAANQ